MGFTGKPPLASFLPALGYRHAQKYPGYVSGAGGVHSGGRYSQMCTFSRLYAREHQVFSGSRARMLKKSKVLTGFFLYRLSPGPRPSAPECERLNAGNNARVVRSPCVLVRFPCVMAAGRAFYCAFQRQHLPTFCAALSASSLLPGNKEVQQPSERRALYPARTVCRSRLPHGFAIDCKRITKDNISEVSICQHTSG